MRELFCKGGTREGQTVTLKRLFYHPVLIYRKSAYISKCHFKELYTCRVPTKIYSDAKFSYSRPANA